MPKGSCLNRGLGVVLLMLLPAELLDGEGFRNPPPGTFNLGRAGGRIAQVNDSSAVQQNPANLVDLTNAEFQATPSIVYIAVDFESAAAPGQSARTESPWKLLPNFFAALPLADGKAAVGLGITVPYGISMEWDRNSSVFDPATGIWRFVGTGGAPYYTRLTTINFNPTLAFKLGDKLRVGMGLDAMWSDLEFKQYISPAAPTWWTKAYGEGVGMGGNLGLTWQITDRQRLAVTYRSPMTIGYDGDFRQFNSPAGNFDSSFNSQLKFPTIVALGYGLQLNDTVRLETDVEWLQFSRFQDLPVNVGSNPTGITSTSIPENWKDTFTAGIGGDWAFARHWVLRGGYQFYQSPVPDSTFSPTIPDADQNVFTIGLGWQGRRNSLEFAYGLDFYNDRHITNDQASPAFNGTYSFNVHLFSLAYHYSF
ncbi:MAG: outer membrane protein transport protein [Verrucomicrobiota bacterium]|nr:outer membrane protein transport protein [Verrucomicrobiota bacterium]